MIFEDAYRTFRARVVSWARYFGATRDAEDVAQDVFVAFKKDGAHIPDAAVPAWLRTVTRREAHRMRARLSRLQLEGTEAGAITEPSQEQQLGRRETEELLLALVARLVHQRREVFLRHVLRGQSVPKIAAALKLPLTTAQTRLDDARADLRAAIKVARAKERRTSGGTSFGVAPLLFLSDLWRRRTVRALATGTGGTGVLALALGLLGGPALEPTFEEPPPRAAIETAPMLSFSFLQAPHEREASERLRPDVSPRAPAASAASAARSAGELREVDLVLRARRALNEGSPARALGYLDRADRAYPAGHLLPERRALRKRASP